jgi:serine/threonine protein kinase
MAHVYLVVSSGPAGFNKLLVSKELKSELADDTEFVKMFLDEARLCARLSHPNIVHTYDVLDDEGSPPCIVMEYLEGQALSGVLSRTWSLPLPLDLHLRALSEALAGLHYAHELKDYDGTALGLVHRDVSPQNVFVCYDGRIKLLDFGVAKVRGALTQTATGVIKGKLAYMAPEVLMGKPIDRRADIFSAGVMLWEALARRRINKGKADVEVTGARVNGGEAKLADVAPNAPPKLVEICERAMALNADDRYATALEFKQALDAEIPATATKEALGELAAEAFAEERKKTAAVIEEAVKNPPPQEPPSLPGASDGESSQPSGSGSGSADAMPTPAEMAATVASPVTPARSSSRKWLAIGAGIVVIGAIAVAASFGGKGEPQAESTTPAASTPAAVATPAPTETASAVPAEPEPAVSASAEPSAVPTPAAPKVVGKAPPTVHKPVPTATATAAATAKPESTAGGTSLGRVKKPPRAIDETDPYAK